MACRMAGEQANGARVSVPDCGMAEAIAARGAGPVAGIPGGPGPRTALIGVDGAARMLFADPKARDLIRSAEVLRLDAGRIAATTDQGTAALRAAIRDVVLRRTAALPLSLPHAAGGEHPVLVSLPEERHPGTGEDQVLVQALDPDHRRAGPAGAWLAVWFGLTPAESEVALRAARGEGLRAIAAALGVQHSTARSHLHRVFQKANLRRQAELAWLVAHLPR